MYMEVEARYLVRLFEQHSLQERLLRLLIFLTLSLYNISQSRESACNAHYVYNSEQHLHSRYTVWVGPTAHILKMASKLLGGGRNSCLQLPKKNGTRRERLLALNGL